MSSSPSSPIEGRRWTLPICARCGLVWTLAKETGAGCTCDPDLPSPGEGVEVMPVEEHEAGREQWEDELLSDEACEVLAKRVWPSSGIPREVTQRGARIALKAALAATKKGGE